MLQLIKAHPWMFGIGVLILLVAVAGIIVGFITKGRWKDRGLIQKDGVQLCWPVSSLPVAVILKKALVQDWMDLVHSFIQNMHLKLGFPVFMLPIEASDDIEAGDGFLRGTVILVPGEEGKAGAATEHRFDTRTGLITQVRVSLPPMDPATAGPILAHEMLHALGLDHDDKQTGSIMSPTLNVAGLITGNDLKVLRETYRA